MEKKKKSNPVFGILLLAVLLAGVGFLVFMYWPWKSLAGEIKKSVDGSGELQVVAVEKIPGNILSLDPESPEAKAIAREIENTKVMFQRNESEMASFGAYYAVEVRRAGGSDHMGVGIKDNGELHLGMVDRTYRVTSKDSKLFELLREAYNR